MLCYDEYGNCLGTAEEVNPVHMLRVFGENGEYLGVVNNKQYKDKLDQYDKERKEYDKSVAKAIKRKSQLKIACIVIMIVIGIIPVLGLVPAIIAVAVTVTSFKDPLISKFKLIACLLVSLLVLSAQITYARAIGFVGKQVGNVYGIVQDIGSSLGGANGAYVQYTDDSLNEQGTGFDNEEWIDEGVEEKEINSLDDMIQQ